MNIGFDAKRFFLNYSGLGNYSRNLIDAISSNYPEENYFLFTPKKNEEFNGLIHSNTQIIAPSANIINKAFWRSFRIATRLKQLDINVYHGLSHELPINIDTFKGKKIVTVHDLIFERYKNQYKPIDRIIYRSKIKRACVNADEIIAISSQTKADLINFYNVPENKISVVIQCCDKVYYNTIDTSIKKSVQQKYALPEKFILYVGTIEERKNLLTLCKAIKTIDDAVLVVVGRKTNYYNEVEAYITKNKIGGRIKFLENVSNTDLPYIYSSASLFVYPSIFEGYGMPLAEAMNCGLPVITSKGSCFEETAGPRGIYIDPNNVEELGIQINRLYFNEDLSESIGQANKNFIAQFNPKAYAEKLMQLYKK